MKTKIKCFKNSYYQLLVFSPENPKEGLIVATLSSYFNSGCWRLTDVRLSEHKDPCDVNILDSAEDYLSTCKPENQEEAEFYKSKLKSFREMDDGKLVWSTFDGLVKGHDSINDYQPKRHYDFHGPGYFSKKEGYEKLKEMQEFWESVEDLSKPWRIENPHSQPDAGSIRMDYHWHLEDKHTEDHGISLR